MRNKDVMLGEHRYIYIPSLDLSTWGNTNVSLILKGADRILACVVPSAEVIDEELRKAQETASEKALGPIKGAIQAKIQDTERDAQCETLTSN